MEFTYSPREASTTIALTATSTVAVIPNMSTSYKGYDRGFFTFETAPVRLGFGGLVPTAANGHKLDQGDTLTVEGWVELSRMKYIRQGATNGKIWLTMEKPQG